jgi:predicted nucleotidyltransferase
MDKKEYIERIVERIKEEQPEKIILFGSHAYGHPDEESDIDLIVIKNLPAKELREFRLKLKLKLWDLIKQWNIPVDIIVDNQERMNQRINDGDMFYKEILSKGNVIYA